MKTILTNDLKNGDKIVLKNGWNATIKDNKKGNTRMAEVEGYYTETGSIYVHDIAYAIKNNERYSIEFTESQKKHKKMLVAMGF